MANFGENFRNGRTQVPCPLCQVHLDSQAMAFQCIKLKSEINMRGKYEDLFKDDIPSELVKTLTKIVDYRTKYLEEKSLQWSLSGNSGNAFLGHMCTCEGQVSSLQAAADYTMKLPLCICNMIVMKYIYI